MTKIKLNIINLCCVALTACAGPGANMTNPQELQLAAHSANSATISGTTQHKSLFNWQQTDIISIDNKFDNSWLGTIHLPAGKHMVTVQLKFLTKFSDEPQGAIVTIPANLSVGGQYHINFVSDEKYVTAWIVDAKNARMSEAVKAVYSDAYRNQ